MLLLLSKLIFGAFEIILYVSFFIKQRDRLFHCSLCLGVRGGIFYNNLEPH